MPENDSQFAGAQHVRVDVHLTFEAFVMPDGENRDGTLADKIADDLIDGLGYRMGMLTDSEPGDGVIVSVFDGHGVPAATVQQIDVTPLGDADTHTVMANVLAVVMDFPRYGKQVHS